MDGFIYVVSLISNLFTIFASGLAIYIFFSRKEEISSVFNLLINYTHQLSLSEVREKIERLNEYNAKDPEQCEHVINIFNEIIGQIRGNERLRRHFSEILITMESLSADKRRLTEPRKRALVSELRERLRHLNVSNIDNLVGENQ